VIARRANIPLLVAGLSLLVGACGGAGTPNDESVAIGRLQHDLKIIDAAVTGHQLTAAQAALATLAADVSAQQRAGHLAPAKAARIQAARARLVADLHAASPAPAVTTTATHAPAAASSPPAVAPTAHPTRAPSVPAAAPKSAPTHATVGKSGRHRGGGHHGGGHHGHGGGGGD
jgi:hypothetical protein